MGDPHAIVKQPTARAMVPDVATGTDVDVMGQNAQVCPPGMEYLLTASVLIAERIYEVTDVFTGFDEDKSFQILDQTGRRIYFVAHKWGCSECCFTLNFLNEQGVLCLKIEKSMGCLECCCVGTCGNKLVMSSLDGSFLGRVQQVCTCWCCCCPERFRIYDADNNPVWVMKGPCCLNEKPQYKIFDMAKNQVGQIRKHWGGIIPEAFAAADNFGVSFPVEMDPRWKTLLLGALFLIKSMFYSDYKYHVIYV